MKKWLITFIGLAIWWLFVPLESFSGREGLPFFHPLILLGMAGILVISFLLRKSECGIVFWLPLFLLPGWELFSTGYLLVMLPVAGAFLGLTGALLPVVFGAAAASLVLFILCIVSYPRKLDWRFLILTIINGIAVCSTVNTASLDVDKQMITVRVTDRFNHPVEGAAVTYKVYGYGNGGQRPSSPTVSGGPILTDDQGIALVQSKKIRYEVVMDISKPGYLPISANLDMQYDESDSTRALKVSLGSSGKDQPTPLGLDFSYIPTADPVKIDLFLPDPQDSPQPLYVKTVGTGIAATGPAYRFFDLHSRRFVPSPDSDLRSDFLNLQEPFNRRLLHITALRGAGIVQIPASPDSYDKMMRIAPLSGYTDQITLNSINSDSEIYFRSPGATYYARIGVHTNPPPPREDSDGTIMLGLFINPSGSRNLLCDYSRVLNPSDQY